MENKNIGEVVIYRKENGESKVKIRLENENLWLSQEQMSILFNKAKSTINEHIKNIFEEKEADENAVIRNFRTTASDGKNYNVKYYSLEMVIAVGYRVRSKEGTNFRIWATEILKEYITKGFAMDDEKLKEAGGGSYWKELLSAKKVLKDK